MNAGYMTIPQYVECKSKTIGKIATYDLLIESMEAAVLEATASGGIAEYEMDDSMMKVRTRYRDIGSMINALNGLIKIRQNLVNKFNGRSTVLRGGNL